MQDPIQCADVIARLNDKYVVIERFTTPLGLALPGGKIDRGETAEHAARREFTEETGLRVVIYRRVGFYDTPGRDPRGPYVSTVFFGHASGQIKSESGKTRVMLLSREDVIARLDQFVADHGKVLKKFLENRP